MFFMYYFQKRETIHTFSCIYKSRKLYSFRLGEGLLEVLNFYKMVESKKDKITNNAFTNYVQASVEELRKVSWPTKNRAIRLTFLVLGFCMVAAIIIGVMDFAFNEGHRSLINLSPTRDSNEFTVTPDMLNITDSEGNPIEINVGDENTNGVIIDSEAANGNQ
jgi:preprotein translocase SecE subunit